MKPKHLLSVFALFALLIANTASVIAQDQPPTGPEAVLGTAITYQGRLNDGGSPASGSYDFQFVLYNAISGGSQVGSLLEKGDVQVTSGYFTIQLDFGAGVFNSQARWLEVRVRPGASTGTFTTLSPRQPLTPAPTALFTSYAGSLPWSGLTGVPAGFADGVDNDSLAALSCSSGQIPKLSGSGWGCAADNNTIYTAGIGLGLKMTTFSLAASYRLPQGCAKGWIPEWTGGAWVCGTKGSFWSLTGNTGTVPSPNYLGTNDNQALELHVNGQRALRLEPSADSPNLLGGYHGNAITTGVSGATISGGGAASAINYITDYFGTVGGGSHNQAGDNAGTVTDHEGATVGGGDSNTASGEDATVSGGFVNNASGIGATVGGGLYNTASGIGATVGGGDENTASGDYSFAAGDGAKATQKGSWVWSDVSGGSYDPFSYINPGGFSNSFNVRATGGVYFVTAIAWDGNPTAGMYMSGGGSGWNTYSDPSFKQNFTPVDSQKVLARLAAVPIAYWNYKSQDATIQHIGPMAPDFNAAFGVGEADKAGDLKYINSLDADGVALAAIQGLYQRNQEQAAQIQALQDQVAHLAKTGGSTPAATLPVIWIALCGFLGLLVTFQAVMFFSLRHKLGWNVRNGGRL